MYGQPIATNHFCYRVLSFITTTCKTLSLQITINHFPFALKKNMVCIYLHSKRKCFELYIIHVSNRLDVWRLFTCIIMKPVSHISLAKNSDVLPLTSCLKINEMLYCSSGNDILIYNIKQMHVYNLIRIKVKIRKLNKYIGYEKNNCHRLPKFECLSNINTIDIPCVDMCRSSSVVNKHPKLLTLKRSIHICTNKRPMDHIPHLSSKRHDKISLIES